MIPPKTNIYSHFMTYKILYIRFITVPDIFDSLRLELTLLLIEMKKTQSIYHCLMANHPDTSKEDNAVDGYKMYSIVIIIN